MSGGRPPRTVSLPPEPMRSPPERETEAPRACAVVGSLCPAWCWVGEGPALLCGACGAPCGPVGAHVRCGRGYFPRASERSSELGPAASLSSSFSPLFAFCDHNAETRKMRCTVVTATTTTATGCG